MKAIPPVDEEIRSDLAEFRETLDRALNDDLDALRDLPDLATRLRAGAARLAENCKLSASLAVDHTDEIDQGEPE